MGACEVGLSETMLVRNVIGRRGTHRVLGSDSKCLFVVPNLELQHCLDDAQLFQLLLEGVALPLEQCEPGREHRIFFDDHSNEVLDLLDRQPRLLQAVNDPAGLQIAIAELPAPAGGSPNGWEQPFGLVVAQG